MEIKIEINQIDTKRGGNLMVFAFRKNGYPVKHKKAIAIKTIAVNKETNLVTLNVDINEGEELAFKVLHDEDMNGKTSKNWTGIWPSEGLAFSNNQKMGIFGPPSFGKCKLSYEKYQQGVSMNIVYPSSGGKK